MTKKAIWVGMLAMVLVFGATTIGCTATEETQLEGTWVFESITLKEGSGAELRAMLETVMRQIPGLDEEMLEEILFQYGMMSDDDLRQFLQFSIDGMWEMLEGSEVTFYDGIVEATVGGMLITRGTFTAEDGQLVQTVTHIHGDLFIMAGMYEFESMLFSMDELTAAFAEMDPMMGDMMDALLSQPMFSEQTATYSLSGNRLTLTDEFGVTTYVRR
ncbi:MAG: hypothetical protein FWC97_00840 [Treponema sp.]|nr:hypothetical protein [Treponema sp.]